MTNSSSYFGRETQLAQQSLFLTTIYIIRCKYEFTGLCIHFNFQTQRKIVKIVLQNAVFRAI